jgi:ribosome-associated protein
MNEFKNVNKEFPTPSGQQLIDVIGEALLQKKAENIKLLDVRKVTTLTDYFIICHATTDTQVKAIADSVTDETKKVYGERVWRKEGYDTSRWIVLDYVNIVVHIFVQDLREYYGIERMWSDAVVSEIKD